MQIVIPVGGYGTRVSHLLPAKTPKAMMEFRGKPFLEYQIGLLSQQGYRDVILSVYYNQKKIRDYFGDGSKWGIKISYVADGVEPLGFGGNIKKVAEKIENDYFGMLDGDTYLPINLPRVEQEYIKNRKAALITITKYYPSYYSGNVEIKGKYVTSIRPNNYGQNLGKIEYIECGFRIINTKTITYFPKKIFHLHDLFQILIAKKELIGYKAERRFREIGCPEGVKDYEKYLKNGYKTHYF